MAEATNVVMNTSEAANNQADCINDMIKEFVRLKKQINKSREERDRLKSDSVVLSMSIWAGEIKYKELRKKEASLRTAIFNTSKITETKEEELKNLAKERRAFFSKLRDKFQAKGAMYMDKFLGAQKEYTTENLTNNIQEYKEKYKEIHKEVTALTEHVKNLDTLSGLHDLNSDQASDAIKTVLSNISEDKNCKLLDINTAQDLLKELKNEIEQKKTILNSFY